MWGGVAERERGAARAASTAPAGGLPPVSDGLRGLVPGLWTRFPVHPARVHSHCLPFAATVLPHVEPCGQLGCSTYIVLAPPLSSMFAVLVLLGKAASFFLVSGRS